ncbi:MAG: hypothetical protein AAGJ35_06000 [Myxococcota bacterium]
METIPKNDEIGPLSRGPLLEEPTGYQVQQMATGGLNSLHICVVASKTEELECWGQNYSGQLGYGDLKPRQNARGDFIDFKGVKVRQVKIDLGVTCALLETGDLKCWGDNRYGRLGYGNTARIMKPVKSIDLQGQKAIQLEMGYGITCVLLEAGNVKCWGENRWWGGLGLGLDRDAVLMKPARQSIDFQGMRVKDISTKYRHMCAVLENGQVKCWGKNDKGQLGYPDFQFRSKPGSKSVALPGKVKKVSCGRWHSCVILEDHSVRCWGENDKGQLGHQSLSQLLLHPIFEPGLP